MPISVDDIQFWIERRNEVLAEKREARESGHYETRGIPREEPYSGSAMYQLSLAFCHTALGNKVEAEAAFKESSLLSQRMFNIAYNPESEYYNPNFRSWHTVSEQDMIHAISCSSSD